MLALLGAIGGMVMIFAGKPGLGIAACGLRRDSWCYRFFYLGLAADQWRNDEYCRHCDRHLRYRFVGTRCDW